MYNLNMILEGLDFNQTDLANFLGVSRSLLSASIKREYGAPKSHLEVLITLDTHILQCNQKNVVMNELIEIKNAALEERTKALLAQLQASERLLERLIKKRDDMSATYQRELAALNRLLYILDVDRWLEAKYRDWIEVRIAHLQDRLTKFSPTQQELLGLKIEATRCEVDAIRRRMEAKDGR